MRKTLLLLLLSFTYLQAQEFEWLQTPEINLSLNPDLVGYVTGCDDSGGVYLVGFKDHATPYNDIFGDLYYNKYNDAGELQFSNTFTGKGSVYDISIDPSGNVLLAIGHLESLTIGTTTFTNSGTGIEPLVAKFNNQGALLWTYIPLINGSPAGYFKTLTTDQSGNVYLGYDNFNNSYIEKLSPEGVSLDLITQTQVSLLSSIDVDTEGNIYATGSCVDPGSTFGGTAVSTALFYNSYIVKYAADGEYKWVRFVDDITCPKPEVKVNTPDEVYFTSYLVDNYVFDGIQTEGPAAGNFNDFFLTRLNADGVFQWVREVPGAGNVYPGKRNYLEKDALGNVYLSGYTRWTIDWGNGMSTSTPSFSSDGLVLKYNHNGDLLMVKTAGGTSEDRFDGIAVNSFGDLYLSGMARSNTTFGTITHESTGNLPYAFLTKLSAPSLGLPTVSSENKPKLYPNPVHESFYLTQTAASSKGTIFNALGQLVLSFETDTQGKVSVSGLPNGIYYARLGNEVIRFIKE